MINRTQQLETATAIFAAIAIMSILSLRILDLRERLRMTADVPAAYKTVP